MTDVSASDDSAPADAAEAAATALIPDTTPVAEKPAYQVLARKYRPQTFAELVGQDALVRTLTNAIREDRIAHAFILTGVRGVGKTTTARIIARALNCIGPDGTGGPTISPCGVCDPCRAIAESRHVDVLEMDAASRTGVDNIRDLLDGVRYLPVSARYKVYIVDEVHMLSMQAFNALLKTLEEPPEHVKFVFATTEIRKVPVTVLSRCQRFDLRRVDAELLVNHFRTIVANEGAEAEDEALALIANAAEGSVRDGLSLLDQAIAHGGGRFGADQVRDMLGLADRTRVFDLFDAVMRGDIAAALTQLRDQYDLGADPLVVLQDMLELTHWLTRLKVVPDAGKRPGVSEAERSRGGALAEGLGMPALARAWQMLLKGIGEVRTAPSAIAAAEMVLVRLAYAANLPSPADLAKKLTEGGATGAQGAAPAAGSAPPAAEPRQNAPAVSGATTGTAAPTAEANVTTAAAPISMTPTSLAPQVSDLPDPDETPEATLEPHKTAPEPDFSSFVGIVALAERRDVMLYHMLCENVRLIAFEPGRITLRPTDSAPSNLTQRLKQRLDEWSGENWTIAIDSAAEGDLPLAEQKRTARAALLQAAEAHPLVQAVQAEFPGARIVDVRPLGAEQDDDPDVDEAAEG